MPACCRVDGRGFPVHDARVKGVFDVGARVGRVEQPFGVRLVLGEEQRRRAVAVEPSIAKLRVRGRHCARAAGAFRRRQTGFLRAGPPAPRVAEPQGWQQMNRRCLRAAVRRGDPDEAFFRRRLGVFDDDVEVAVFVEHAGVDELVLELLARAARVGLHEVVVREGGLRVFVEPLHVGVRRRGIQIEVVLLDVLPVVPLAVAQTEKPLLQNRVLPVPQRQRETQPLLDVAEAREPVLSPVVRAGPRVIVGEVVPRVAVPAVVLAHRPPLPLADVRPPDSPGRVPLT